jgi:hypothetical protein
MSLILLLVILQEPPHVPIAGFEPFHIDFSSQGTQIHSKNQSYVAESTAHSHI